MASSINKPCVTAFAVTLALFGFNARADFDEATKAYLLGNYEQARYEALIAATDGNAKAQMLLGQLYYNGEGVAKDIPHALHWYNKSAENGFVDAQYRLGLLYHDGTQGVERNYDIAYKWLSKALENGNTAARDKLEWLFKTEQGKVVNLNEDVEVLKQVAASGNQQARFLLSQKMLKGDGIQQDKLNAVRMLREDAEVGFVKAQKQLGELFFYGDGVEKDYIEAYAWSMAYAGTKELGGIAREGKQTARSSLRKLPEEEHNTAYIKSREYFESYVLPFHKNAREVGPEKYRIVVRSEVKKESAPQQQASIKQSGDKPVPAGGQLTGTQTTAVPASVTGGAASGSSPDDGNKKVEGEPPGETAQSGSPTQKIKGQVILPQESSPQVTLPVTRADTPKTEPAPDADSVARQIVKENESRPEASSYNVMQSAQTQAQAPDETTNRKQAIVSATIEESSKTEKELASQQARQAGEPETADTARPVASREDLEIISAEPSGVAAAADVAKSDGKELPERKFEDVYNVLVRKKSALYQLYAREYELDKKLEGRIVFEIVISPNGKISTVEITSNTLESPTLEQEFIDFLKANVNFAPADVAEYKISYPVDFLPPP